MKKLILISVIIGMLIFSTAPVYAVTKAELNGQLREVLITLIKLLTEQVRILQAQLVVLQNQQMIITPPVIEAIITPPVIEAIITPPVIEEIKLPKIPEEKIKYGRNIRVDA